MNRYQYRFILWMLFLACIPSVSQAQYKSSTEDNNIWYTQPGDTILVYSRTANVRETPSLSAAVQDSLFCGAPVTLIKQVGGQEQLKGIYAPWAKVQYRVNATVKEGYIWLGLLSLGHYYDSNTCFLYGLERIETPVLKTEEDYQPSVWYFRVKALDGDRKLLAEKEDKMTAVETSVTSGKLLGNMGLANTSNIVRISFGGEACGIPEYYYYFGWTGSQFLSLPGKMGVGDAGVFYHSETLLFPKEPGGQAGKIIRLSEEGEAQEENDKNGEPVFKVKKTREVYLWDGSKARKQS